MYWRRKRASDAWGDTLFMSVFLYIPSLFSVYCRYEPWIGSGSSSSSSNDQSSYKLLAATRKPAEDLRAATKLELNAAAPTATKSAVVAAAPSTSLYAWKMSGFSQCSASCLGGTYAYSIINTLILKTIVQQNNSPINAWDWSWCCCYIIRAWAGADATKPPGDPSSLNSKTHLSSKQRIRK